MRGEGRALGIGFARYKNMAAYSAVVVEVEVEEEVRLEAHLVRGRCRPRHQSRRGEEPARRRHHPGRELRHCASSCASPRAASPTQSWDDYPILRFSDVPEIEIELVGDPNDPALGLGECSVGPAGGGHRQCGRPRAGRRIRDLPLTRERIMAALLADTRSMSVPIVQVPKRWDDFPERTNALNRGPWIDHFGDNFLWSNATLILKGMAPYGVVALEEIDRCCERLRAREGEPDRGRAWKEEWSALGAAYRAARR